MLKKIKIGGKIIYRLIIAVVVFLAGITLLSTFNTRLTTNLFVVQSGSMQPTISTGSLIIVKSVENYSVGNIVTFTSSGLKVKPQGLTTHRIVETREVKERKEYVTKGDANNAPDSATVKNEQVLGKVILAIPYLGYPISFTKTLPGLILFIVIPATIIVYQELINLKNDIVRKLVKKKKEKHEEKKKE